jgi:imidazolonepropionase-like amidohydrolase
MTHNGREVDLILKKVTLIDGTGAGAKPAVNIHIADGKISSICSTKDDRDDRDDRESDYNESDATVGNSEVLDLSGKYVMPGLIDCHVHLAIDGSADCALAGDPSWTLLQMLKHAQTCLQSGITSMRDVGGRHHKEFLLRKAFESGMWSGPRLSLAGKLLSITSSASEFYDGMYRECDGVEEVRKAAREQFKAGADLIKLMATGAVMAPGEKPGATQFNLDEITAIVEEARKLEKPVAAHAHAVEGIRNAVTAGVSSIEHGTFLYRDPRLMEEMAKKNIYLVPTLKVFHDFVNNDRGDIPKWMAEKAKSLSEHHRRSISEAIQAGVPIAMGTDAATPYNFHGLNAKELQLMADCGMPALKAIVCATSNAAKLLGWDSWVGTIEPGKVADLLVLNRNPLDDLRVLSDRENIHLVMLGGKAVSGRIQFRADELPEAVHAHDFVCCGLPAIE